jgi:uncharacterized protein (TIGR02246 family)
MKRHLCFTLSALGLLLCPLAAQNSVGQEPASAEICKLEEESDTAAMAHDGKSLAKLFAEEYQHTNFIGGVTDKAAELRFFTSPDFSLRKAEIDACNVHVYGKDVAVATGINNWIEASYKGTDISGRYRYTTVYVQRDGHWQIVAGHASMIRR